MALRIMQDEDNNLGAWLSASLDDDSVCDEMKEAVNKWFESFKNLGVKFTYEDREFITLDAEVEGRCFGCVFNDAGLGCPDRSCDGVIFNEVK